MGISSCFCDSVAFSLAAIYRFNTFFSPLIYFILKSCKYKTKKEHRVSTYYCLAPSLVGEGEKIKIISEFSSCFSFDYFNLINVVRFFFFFNLWHSVCTLISQQLASFSGSGLAAQAVAWWESAPASPGSATATKGSFN